jgi:Ni2+-binding GTPase involved in maturation of urease and hydrogenase
MIIWMNGAFGSGKTSAAFELNRRLPDSVDRCIHAFDNLITNEKIDTERMSVDAVVNEIAERCGFSLPPDQKTGLGRLLYRAGVLLRHIR